jgi:hypothetical protein
VVEQLELVCGQACVGPLAVRVICVVMSFFLFAPDLFPEIGMLIRRDFRCGGIK